MQPSTSQYVRLLLRRHLVKPPAIHLLHVNAQGLTGDNYHAITALMISHRWVPCAVAVAGLCMVCMMISMAWRLYMQGFNTQAADEAAAAADEAAAAAGAAGERAAEQHLKRVTPYIVMQPDAEIMFGMKDSAAGQGAHDTAAESTTAGAPGLVAEHNNTESYSSTGLYTIDICNAR